MCALDFAGSRYRWTLDRASDGIRLKATALDRDVVFFPRQTLSSPLLLLQAQIQGRGKQLGEPQGLLDLPSVPSASYWEQAIGTLGDLLANAAKAASNDLMRPDDA